MKLTIKNKEYQLEWGMGAIEIYCDMRDCDIDDIDTHLGSAKLIHQMKAINMLTLAALKNGCENQKPRQEFDLDYSEFLLWMDKQPQEVRDSIIEDWKKSYYFGKTVAEYIFGEIPESDLKVKKKIASAK